MTTALPALAVTGVTGVLGGLVAGRLAAAGTAQRLLARTVSKVADLPNSVVFPISYVDREACAVALDGVQTLLMVSAAESADRLDQHLAFIDSAVAAGVAHIVYTSFVGAAPDAVFTLGRDHYATEEYIKSTGLDYTFLRDNIYLDFMEALVGEDGVIRGPAGTGRAAGVARTDIARTAATVLTAPNAHVGRTYRLSGPEALTMAEVAGILSEARGSVVTFHDETIEEAYRSRAKWEAPDWQTNAWVTTYTAIAAGELAQVTNDITTVTGTPPLSLAQFLAGG
jgi:NAD(P)H dehydrogenase (quinone)